MPIYMWRCKKCGGKVEKLISITDYHEGNYDENAVDEDTTTEGLDEKCDHDLKREVESGIRVTRGDGWGGKGYW